MSVYVFSLLGNRQDEGPAYATDLVEIPERSAMTEDVFRKELKKLMKKHHYFDCVLLNVFKLDDEVTEDVEAIMEGDCTQCGHIDPEGTPPYQCQIHGMTQNGGCGAWCPKGVVDDD